jgi:DNA relaxase NicK
MRYLRVYDKGVEQKDAPPGVRWRAELELKGRAAEVAWAEVKTGVDLASYSCSRVSDYLRSRGGWYPNEVRTIPVASLRVAKPQRIPDVERAAQFLRKQARGAVATMIRAGAFHELEEALGLSPHYAVYLRPRTVRPHR